MTASSARGDSGWFTKRNALVRGCEIATGNVRKHLMGNGFHLISELLQEQSLVAQSLPLSGTDRRHDVSQSEACESPQDT